MNVVRRPFESRRSAQSFLTNSFSIRSVFVFICTLHTHSSSICLKLSLVCEFVFRFNFFSSLLWAPVISPGSMCLVSSMAEHIIFMHGWKRCRRVCWFSVVFVPSLFRRNWMKIYDSFRSSHTRPRREHCTHTHSIASYTTGHYVYSINRREKSFGKHWASNGASYRRVLLVPFFLCRLPFAVYRFHVRHVVVARIRICINGVKCSRWLELAAYTVHGTSSTNHFPFNDCACVLCVMCTSRCATVSHYI